MTRHVGWVEPLERKDPRARATGNAVTNLANALQHVPDQHFSSVTDARCAADIPYASEDGGEIMSIETQDLNVLSERQDLTLRHCTDVANALRNHEIGLERANRIHVDLVHTAVVAQRRADRRIDLAARQSREISAGA